MGKPQVRSRGNVFASVLVVAVALLPATATAATNLAQKPGPAGCITETGSSGQCQDGRGLVGSASIELSSDGMNAYVASSQWNSVSILTRNAADGTLAPVGSPSGCFDSLEALYPDCTPARELGGANDVAVSDDGKSVYVTTLLDDAVVVFDRDPLTGQLTLSAATDGCVNDDGSESCADGRALSDPRAIAVSPDDQNVYVVSSGANGGIAVFDRNTTTGDLTQKAGTAGCINPGATDGCAAGSAQLLDTRAVAISADGKNVYAGSRTHDAITIYDRAGDGTLTPKAGSAGCIDENGEPGCANGTALIDPDGITVGPGGGSLYVAASRSDAIAVFDRNTMTGELTQKPGTAACISNTGASNPMQAGTAGACQDGVAMDGLDSIAVLPDGTALYAATANSSGIMVYERRADGTLAQRPGTAGCITNGGYEDPSLSWTAGTCEDGAALIGASSVVAGADSMHVYSAALEGGIGIFDVVAPPSPPAPESPPPSLPTPQAESAACTRAHIALYKAERSLAKAQRAARGHARRNEARAVRRAQRTVKRWQKATRRARRQARSSCAGA